MNGQPSPALDGQARHQPTGVLAGFRVLELTHGRAGALAGVFLADLGADVIKVEEGGTRDAATDERGAGSEAFRQFCARGKKRVALDRHGPKGQAILRALAAKCDVLLLDLGPTTIAAEGLEYEALSALSPGLVYAHLSAWGARGPAANAAASDLLAQARSSFLVQNGDGDGPPAANSSGVADQAAAVAAVFGVIAALFDRERTGLGQKVETSLLSALMCVMSIGVACNLNGGIGVVRISRAAASNPLWNQYQCRDGKWISLAMSQLERQWPVACRALGLEAIRDDPRFAGEDAIATNCRELVRIFDETFARKDRDEWIAILRKARGPFSPINSVEDLREDPQVVANDYLVAQEHPTLGRLVYPANPVKLSLDGLPPKRPESSLGPQMVEKADDRASFGTASVAWQGKEVVEGLVP